MNSLENNDMTIENSVYLETHDLSSKECEDKQFMNIEKWDEMNLNLDLLRGIYAYGFEVPSNIQKIAIPYIISGNDVIGQAQSGSGKTGTFIIGTLQMIDLNSKTIQAIIIAPTHELVKQIAMVCNNLGSIMKGLVVKVLIGGTSINDDINDLKKNTPHIIIGCTGRIYDMIKRNHIQMKTVNILILDEADEMLSQGFKTQIYNIFQYCKPDIQVALFSATIPDEVMTLTQKFMRNPKKITMKPEELNLECITQYYVAVMNDSEKYTSLINLYSTLSVSQSIIYVNSISRVIELYNSMKNDDYPVCCIHSSMTKIDRENTLLGFRNGTYRILISSNITARGIDVQQVQTVINFDIPRCVHTYLHRIGRSGRYGRKGIAINFVTKNDIFHIRNIENHYKSNIVEFPSQLKES